MYHPEAFFPFAVRCKNGRSYVVCFFTCKFRICKVQDVKFLMGSGEFFSLSFFLFPIFYFFHVFHEKAAPSQVLNTVYLVREHAESSTMRTALAG